ncbi:MAG: hypothetical protein NTW96_01745 [Planctomycetia bacterium]|nr:hypothetical protein [Planctomycetia bacterium]
MKQEWDALLDDAREGRVDPGRKLEKLIRLQRSLLENNLSMADMRHLAATCETLPIHEWKDPNGFETRVLQFVVSSLIDAGDRDSLVTLLSTRYPVNIGPETNTAYWLVVYAKKSLKDPVLVLGDAYSRCKVPEVQSDIAAAVRQCFEGFDIPGKDDAEYVANAMQWYEKEKSHLTAPDPKAPAYFGYDNQKK